MIERECPAKCRCKTLDRRITEFYRHRGVCTHGDISLHRFDDLLEITVMHRPGPTYTAHRNGTWYVWLDSSQPLHERRVRMAHEIGHALLHAGSQLFADEGTRLKEEEQARRFALYALVPTCFLLPLLRQFNRIDQSALEEISSEFGVPEWFMYARLERLKADQIVASNLFSDRK